MNVQMTDLEIMLQAGSLIVENLRTYRQPVIVYLPPGAELRGGAWVVVDGQINSQQVKRHVTTGNSWPSALTLDLLP